MISLTLIILGNDNPDWATNAMAVLGHNGLYELKHIIQIDPSSYRGVSTIYTFDDDDFDFFEFNIESLTSFLKALQTINTEVTAILTANTNIMLLPPKLTNLAIASLPTAVELPRETAKQHPVAALNWMASTPLLKAALPQLEINRWSLLGVAIELERQNIAFNWGTTNINFTSLESEDYPKNNRFIFPRIANNIDESNINYTNNHLITNQSRVLAVIPHYRCEQFLHRCLQSLVAQTRPLEGIVVIDDGSESPPIDIVREFPGVTLLASAVNVGPYRLIQQAIALTNYDAYLFQDADDWSSANRLELLLAAAENTGAELVGTQELRVFEDDRLLPVVYPLNVSAALAEKPGHPLLHPTSLVSRDLVLRLGGFATGLRFSGDSEFLLRSQFVAKIVNIPDYAYFRRHRDGSLTTDRQTGLNAPVRLELIQQLKSRAIANTAAVREGKLPDLRPLKTAEAIELNYITGASLNWENSYDFRF
ncbi:glycosyltransferase family 2 protein [Microcoleus sp. LEGE 07076]|uniref:glycosyltransferase family 2 protein n=1 Tax=Microcoleus sp. LEGE 07076 TaxID=915322 RepID=UPI001880CCCE|nr:glycosyltransferase family 2 protein [Microcoleus sp. LEGE 07076]MBE9186922.1 glycosyltransferase family 2 protein [Microcoleus sp. LEGE 07076]